MNDAVDSLNRRAAIVLAMLAGITTLLVAKPAIALHQSVYRKLLVSAFSLGLASVLLELDCQLSMPVNGLIAMQTHYANAYLLVETSFNIFLLLVQSQSPLLVLYSLLAQSLKASPRSQEGERHN